MTLDTRTLQAPSPTGWTVEVEVGLGRSVDGRHPADVLATALMQRTARLGASVLVLDRSALVTLDQPVGDDVHDAGQALVHGVSEALRIVGSHVLVDRVRHAEVSARTPARGPRLAALTA